MSDLSNAVAALVEISDTKEWEIGYTSHQHYRYNKFVHKPSKFEIHLCDESPFRGIVYVQGVQVGWWDKRKIQKSIKKLLARQAHDAVTVTWRNNEDRVPHAV